MCYVPNHYVYQFGETVGHPPHIYGRWYRSHRYITGLGLEKLVMLVFWFIDESRRPINHKFQRLRCCRLPDFGSNSYVRIVRYITMLSLISKIMAFSCLVNYQPNHMSTIQIV